METAHAPNLLKTIGKVFEEAQESKLAPAFFESIDGELCELSDYLKTTKSQAFFVAILFVMSHWKDKVSINNLIDHFHCSIVQILEFNNDFEFLLSRHILTKQKSKYLRKLHPTKNEFAIHESIVEAILHNKPMPELEE
ncbi:MAG TPA: AAA family ATPase, partial [Salinimicrobium sp.]|nr:AAA family ATPase [Salinimicrobium sp.]